MRHAVSNQNRPQPDRQSRRGAPTAPPHKPSEQEDELSISVQAHDGHFLERTLRCEGTDLDRAVRLYHHAPVVKQLLKELVTSRHPRGRLAIPLREAGPSPHVIVTEGGSFVTCLAEHMSIADLPVLPYQRFTDAMDRADREIARSRVRRQQFKDLPWQTLFDALIEGPGHVTREMIEVFDRDPESYMIPVAKVYTLNIKVLSDKIRTACKANRATRELEVLGMKAFGRLKMCAYLMGFIHSPYILNIMLPFVNIDVGMEVTLGIAIARHPEGGQRLLDLAEKNEGVPKALRTMGAYFMHCCMLNPPQAEAVCRRFRSLPLRYDGWEVSRLMCETLLRVPAEQMVKALTRGLLHPKPPVVPRSATWIFFDDELLKDAFWHRSASLYFPPTEQIAAVRTAWGQRLRQIEEWRGHKAENTVPVCKESRIGRNDPCPCKSGKKHKQCCLGKPTGPTKEELEAAQIADRESFVTQHLESTGMISAGTKTTS